MKLIYGGFLRCIVAINPSITNKALDFIKICLEVNVITTYSITEALGIVIASNSDNPRSDFTGYPVALTSIKLSFENITTNKESKNIDDDFDEIKSK